MAVFVRKTEVTGVMNANIPVICKYFTNKGGGGGGERSGSVVECLT